MSEDPSPTLEGIGGRRLTTHLQGLYADAEQTIRSASSADIQSDRWVASVLRRATLVPLALTGSWSRPEVEETADGIRVTSRVRVNGDAPVLDQLRQDQAEQTGAWQVNPSRGEVEIASQSFPFEVTSGQIRAWVVTGRTTVHDAVDKINHLLTAYNERVRDHVERVVAQRRARAERARKLSHELGDL